MKQRLVSLLCLLFLAAPGVMFVLPGSSLAAAGAALAAGPSLTSTTELARAGNYQLRWGHESPMVHAYRLERADNPLFSNSVLVYEGADRATVISGRSDGVMHYRVRAQFSDGSVTDWSEPTSVTVQHHPLTQALLLFALGALVFVATIVLIITGNRTHQRDRASAR